MTRVTMFVGLGLAGVLLLAVSSFIKNSENEPQQHSDAPLGAVIDSPEVSIPPPIQNNSQSVEPSASREIPTREEPSADEQLFELFEDWAANFLLQVSHSADSIPDWCEFDFVEGDAILLTEDPPAVAHVRGLAAADPEIQAEFEAYAVDVLESQIVRSKYLSYGAENGLFELFQDRASADAYLRENGGYLHYDGESFVVADMSALERSRFVLNPEYRLDILSRARAGNIGSVVVFVPTE